MTNLETSERTLAAICRGSNSRRAIGFAFEQFASIDAAGLRITTAGRLSANARGRS